MKGPNGQDEPADVIWLHADETSPGWTLRNFLSKINLEPSNPVALAVKMT